MSQKLTRTFRILEFKANMTARSARSGLRTDIGLGPKAPRSWSKRI